MKSYLTISILLFVSAPAFAESFAPSEDDNSWVYQRPNDWAFRHPNSPDEIESGSDEEADRRENSKPEKRRRRPRGSKRKTEVVYERNDRAPDRTREESLAEETRKLVSDERARPYRVASIEPEPVANTEERVTGEKPSEAGALQVRLGVLLGMTSLASEDERVQAARSEQALSQNFLVGLNADLQYAKYFGAEVDAFMGIAPTVTIAAGAGKDRTKSLKQSGAMAGLKFQYPAGRFTPKLGVGYGMLGTSQTDEGGGQTSLVSGSYKGPYATLGFDVRLTEDFLFTADFAQSISTSVSVSATTDGTEKRFDLTGGGYNRIRVAGYLKVAPKLYGGLQFTARKIKAVQDPAASLSGEGLSQFMAVGMIEF